MLVLAAQGRISPRLAIFANVGERAENPSTLAYVRDVAGPYAAEHGIELVEVQRGGKWPDLYERLTHPESRFLGIPVRFDRTGAPAHRSCTTDYKIEVIGKELKRRGATPTEPATVSIGISTDEWMRANRRKVEPHETATYPLLDLGLSRADCMRLVKDAGLPVPDKSSCWFCPFHSKQAWRYMRTDSPELFERAAALEDTLNERRAAMDKDPVWLTDAGIPLRQAVMDSDALFGPETDAISGECDNAWCTT